MYKTVWDDLQTQNVQLSKDGIVFAFWSFCEKNERNAGCNQKKNEGCLDIFTRILNRKHKLEKPKKISAKIKTIIGGAPLI